MPVMDEFSQEREAVKNFSLKKKLEYFWYYYKWYVIGGAFAFILIFSFIYDLVTAKDYAFYGVFLNSLGREEISDTFLDDFIELASLDTEEYNVVIDDSLYITPGAGDEASTSAQQKVILLMAAGDLDVLSADAESFEHYATTDNFLDLRTILSQEQLEKYEPYFYYVDMAQLRQLEEAANSGNMRFELPDVDHHDPSSMEEPVPIALYINNSKKVTDAYAFSGREVPMGVAVTTKRVDTVLQFIDYIFE